MNIPCISVMQPHASLIALNAKAIETRSRDFTAGYRGPIGIAASKRFPWEYQELCLTEPFCTALEPTAEYPKYEGVNYITRGPVRGWHLPLGCIVAVCDLVDVVRIEHNPNLEVAGEWPVVKHLFGLRAHGNWWRDLDMSKRYEQEMAFGDYTPGRYMLLLRNVVALEKPIPAKGRLGLWEFEMEDPRR